MADSPFDAQTMAQLQGLLGFINAGNPDDLKKIEKDKWLTLGLGLLGGKKGDEAGAIGRAGLNAIQNANQERTQLQLQRGQNINQAMNLQTMLQQMQRNQGIAHIFDQPPPATGGVAPVAGVSPRTAAQFGPQGGDTTGFQPYPPAPLTVPQGTAPTDVTAYQRPDWRQTLAPATIAAMKASGDPKLIAEYTSKGSETKMSADGTVTTIDGRLLYKPTESGIQYFDAQGRPAQFVGYSGDNTKAAAKRAATIAGETTAATESARNPYQIVEGADASGRTVKGYAPSVLGQPPVPTAAPSPAAVPPGTPYAGQPVAGAPGVPKGAGYTGQASPVDRVAILRQELASETDPRNVASINAELARLPQPAATPGTLVGPDPIVQKQREGRVATQVTQDTEIAKSGATDYNDAIKAERNAPIKIAKYEQLKNYYRQVDTGKLAPSILNLKAMVSSIPGMKEIAKDWTAEVPFAQAAAALSNAMALELRNPSGGAGMPGQMSNQDRDFLVSMISSAANDPRAVPLILDAQIAIERRNQEVGKMVRAYKGKHGTIDSGFYQQLSDYGESHPLFSGQATAPGRTVSGTIGGASTGAQKTVRWSDLP